MTGLVDLLGLVFSWFGVVVVVALVGGVHLESSNHCSLFFFPGCAGVFVVAIVLFAGVLQLEFGSQTFVVGGVGVVGVIGLIGLVILFVLLLLL